MELAGAPHSLKTNLIFILDAAMNVPDPPPSAALIRLARPELNQLEVFLAVAETGSFSAAARNLGRTQPAVSQTIARLEEIYGGDLFERGAGAPLALTPVGKAILPSARILLHTVDELMQRAIATAQGRLGSLSIGLEACLGLNYLGAGIRDFMKANPDVRLRLVEAHSRELHRQLHERLIDIAFVAQIGDSAAIQMMHEVLWEERLAVVMRSDHPLAGKVSLHWGRTASLSLILPASLRDPAGAILKRLGDGPLRCAYHAATQATLLELVAMGLGQTIAIASTIPPRPDIVARPIDGDEALVKTAAIWPREDRNPLRHRLLNHVRRTRKAS